MNQIRFRPGLYRRTSPAELMTFPARSPSRLGREPLLIPLPRHLVFGDSTIIPSGQIHQQILTVDSLKYADLSKDGPFGGLNDE